MKHIVAVLIEVSRLLKDGCITEYFIPLSHSGIPIFLIMADGFFILTGHSWLFSVLQGRC
jgi:hypothetical protein